MDNQMVKVLNNIHFAERYEALRIQYSFDLKESFKNYDNQYVLKMLQEIGYEAVKYRKRENFFQAKKKSNIYEFRYHIFIKSGIAELMWYVMKDNKYYEGGTFPNLEYSTFFYVLHRSLYRILCVWIKERFTHGNHRIRAH